MLKYLFAKKQCVDVGIYFRRRYLLVPQHILNGTQIGSAFQEMRRERMSEGVGADVLVDACHLCLLFDDMKDHDT